MRMQEPEPEQPLGQEWQAGQEYSGYRANYSGRYEPEQQQKIYPQEERGLQGKVFWIISIVLSSLGFFLTIAGIVASAIVLKYANGQEELLTGGVIGLLSLIGVMLVCVAIFVMAVIVLAGRTRRGRS